MAGRIGIDDVAPVVSAGRYPAKAVVGEVVPVRATVWREGHDAVAATLVVRYHGTAYPQLAEGPAQEPPASRYRSRLSSRRAHGSNRRPSRWPPGGRRTCSTACSPPTGSDCGRFGSTAGATPIATWRQAITAKLDAGQSETELSNDLIVGARLLERAATGVPRAPTRPAHRGRARSCASRAIRSPARAPRCPTR